MKGTTGQIRETWPRRWRWLGMTAAPALTGGALIYTPLTRLPARPVVLLKQDFLL